MKLEDLEHAITGVARKYSSSPHDIKDYEQLGRIVAWEILSKEPTREKPYILGAVNHAILNELRKNRAQKRLPSGGLVSLDEPIAGFEDLTLGDTIGTSQDFSSKSELLETLHREIKGRYGKRYLMGIRKECNPRRIVSRLIRAIISEVEEIPQEEIPRKVNYQFFVERDMARLLWVFYKNSAFRAVQEAYPGIFLPWEFNRVPKDFWTGKDGSENILQALNWFKEKRGIKDENDCMRIRGEDFENDGLDYVLNYCFNGVPYLALKTIFPNLQPWQTSSTPDHFFDSRENQLTAILSFLVSNNLPSIVGLNSEETYELGLRKLVSKDNLGDHGLRVVLKHHGGSTYRLFKNLFPEQILPWTLAGVKEAWKEEPRKIATKAIRWLFDDYLAIPQDELPKYASNYLFWRVGFSGILTNKRIGFSSSPYRAVNSAYPGIFSESDFRGGKGRVIMRVDTPDLRKSYVRKQQN